MFWYCVFIVLFFVIKQKTAYEMRISDWSSDVCSSDLFTQQLVSYSQVEQAIQQTSKLDALLQLTAAQDLNAATGLIGRELTISQPVAPLGVDGAHWSYGLAASADTVKLKVIDASGKVVRTLDGAKTAGVHDLAWEIGRAHV